MDTLGMMIKILQGDDPEDPLVGLINSIRNNRDEPAQPPKDDLGRMIDSMEVEAGQTPEDLPPMPQPRPTSEPRTIDSPHKGWFDTMFHLESSGDQNAVSPKGAEGIAQLLPETAAETASMLGEPFSKEMLRDPSWSKRMGIATFNRFAKQFDNDPWLGLAAYNAGPGRVRRAGGKAGNIMEILPKLPPETRTHLQKMATRLGIGIGDAVVP